VRAALNDFAFRGLLGRQCVTELQHKGLLRLPAATSAERADHDLMAPVPETIRTSSLAMQRNYRLLFVFENVIREFIALRLSETDGDGWFDKRGSAAMKQKVADRREKEEKNQWHVGRNSHAIFYLDFGDLGALITTHWAVFKDFFENQAWVLSRIQEAERTRNVIAHTNVLAAEEAQRLEMYLRDWIKQVV
jgi:hypothetical protein